MSGLNKIVTSISALTDTIVMPNTNDVVCIDTENSRIGVKTSSPEYDIDVSGTIKTNILRLGTNAIISISNGIIDAIIFLIGKLIIAVKSVFRYANFEVLIYGN